MPKTHHGETSYHPRRPLFNRPGNPARATPAELHRQRRAVDLFAAGLTYQQIADELGYAHRASAYNAVWKAMARNPARLRPAHSRRQDTAAWLRMDGWTWQEVADELGYATRSGAYRAAQRALQRTHLGIADRAV